jgi:hypothetical protein
MEASEAKFQQAGVRRLFLSAGKVHRGKFGQRYVYELLYAGEGRDGEPFLVGLIDPAELTEPTSPAAPMPQTSSIAGSTSSMEPAASSIG